MLIGSPSQSERPKSSATYAVRNARVTSARAARVTTRPPTHAMRNPKNAPLPHWPGDTQTRPSAHSSRETRAKFVGLNRCLAFQRKANLLAMAATAATAASQSASLLNSRQSDRAEMSALLGSNSGSLQSRVKTYCESSATERIVADAVHVTSKRSPAAP